MHLGNVSVIEGSGEESLPRPRFDKEMQYDRVIFRIHRVPVPFPVQQFEIQLDRTGLGRATVNGHGGIHKIRPGQTVPCSKLNHSDGIPRRRDKLTPKVSGKPTRLHFNLRHGASGRIAARMSVPWFLSLHAFDKTRICTHGTRYPPYISVLDESKLPFHISVFETEAGKAGDCVEK
jgi:hypothetical protein